MTGIEEIGAYLSTIGVVTSAIPLSYNGLPLIKPSNSNVRALSLQEYAGEAADLSLGADVGTVIEYLSIQMLSRATNPLDAMAPLELAYKDFLIFRNRILGSTYYITIRPNQRPFPLKYDDKNNPIFAMNITAQKRVTA